MQFKPTMLAIGIAPPGGELPTEWDGIIRDAISHGLHIMSGLHHFLSDNDELAAVSSEEQRVILWDARKPPENLPVATCKADNVDATVVLTVGSDCRVGKMLSGIEITKTARTRGTQR